MCTIPYFLSNSLKIEWSNTGVFMKKVFFLQNISVFQWKCCSIFFLQQFWGQTSLLNQEEVLLPLVFPNHCCFAVSRSYHKYNEGDTWNGLYFWTFLPIVFSQSALLCCCDIAYHTGEPGFGMKETKKQHMKNKNNNNEWVIKIINNDI